MVRQGKGDEGVLSSTGIDDYLPPMRLIIGVGNLRIWFGYGKFSGFE